MSVALAEHTGPWTPDDVEAAIPVYWRVELQAGPRIVVSTLSRGRYVTRATLTAGTIGRITKPFPVEIDPAHLTRRIG